MLFVQGGYKSIIYFRPRFYIKSYLITKFFILFVIYNFVQLIIFFFFVIKMGEFFGKVIINLAN